MAQVVKTICDIHNAENEQEVSGERVHITLGDFDGYLDVCVTHNDHLFSELLAAIKQYGTSAREAAPVRQRRRRSAKESVSAESVTCPLGNCGTYAHEDSLRGHVRKAHGHQALLTLFGDEAKSCPVPDCDNVLKGSYGLRMHLRRTHPDVDPDAATPAKKARGKARV